MSKTEQYKRLNSCPEYLPRTNTCYLYNTLLQNKDLKICQKLFQLIKIFIKILLKTGLQNDQNITHKTSSFKTLLLHEMSQSWAKKQQKPTINSHLILLL